MARKEKLRGVLVPTMSVNENVKWLFQRADVHSRNVSLMESQLEGMVGEKEKIHKCPSSSKHTHDEKSVIEYTTFCAVRMAVWRGI